MENKLTHFDDKGNAVMVDVSDKNITKREAIAKGKIYVNDAVMDAVINDKVEKGDVLGVARVAGIMAVKRTWELIPMCHPLMITKCSIDFNINEEENYIEAICTANVNGKTGVDIHIIKALLLKAGVTWKIIKDYTPLYEYTDSINVYEEDKLPEYAIKCKSKKEADEKIAKDNSDDHIYVYPVKFYRDVQGNIYRDYQLDSLRFGIAVNKQQIMELSKANKIAVYRIPAVPIDYVTEYEIYRTINGKEVTARGRFTKLEAQAADLFTKDTYNKYARILISHRAFTYAAREIASDIIMGVMETTELKIVAGKELSDEELLTVEEAEVVE